VVCIIPARGGSSRLPWKNVKKLFGMPVVNRVVEIADGSGLFDKIIVSTDSAEIARTVEYADVHIRPERLWGDVAEDEVLRDVVNRYPETRIFCRIYPFAALLTPARLQYGFTALNSNLELDCVMEAQEYEHPIQRAIRGNGKYNEPEHVHMKTQELWSFYHDAGTYMFFRKGALGKPLARRVIKWLPVSWIEAQDIDDMEDWEKLMMKYAWQEVAWR